MLVTLTEEFKKYRMLPPSAESFLQNLEQSIAQDLWESAGGEWLDDDIQEIRRIAISKWQKQLVGFSAEQMQEAWFAVVRDFHREHWGFQGGELRLSSAFKDMIGYAQDKRG